MLTCEHCGKQFNRSKNCYRFCSIACRNKANAIPGKRSTFECQWCHNEFEEWTYRQPKFCSNQCRSEYAARQPKPSTRRPENFVTIECEICGTEYTVHKAQAKLRNSRFCSNDCKALHNAERMKGKNNPNYIDGTGSLYPNRGSNWGQQRNKALKRDNYQCQRCGGDHRLQVHHIKPYRLFDNDWKRANRLSNLIVLCHRCHVAVERGAVPLPKKNPAQLRLSLPNYTGT